MLPALWISTFLAAELRNLDYNIYTNGGQYWLDQEWHRTFERIMWRIRELSEMSCVGVCAMNNKQSFHDEFDLVYSYTRGQAIADGILVDVSDMAGRRGSASLWQSPRASGMAMSSRTRSRRARARALRAGSGTCSISSATRRRTPTGTFSSTRYCFSWRVAWRGCGSRPSAAPVMTGRRSSPSCSRRRIKHRCV